MLCTALQEFFLQSSAKVRRDGQDILVGSEEALILADHHGDDGAGKRTKVRHPLVLGLMQGFDLQSLPPSRRRSFAFIHTLLHLLFRLLVVFLLGRLDGLSRAALRREGTFEHRESTVCVRLEKLRSVGENLNDQKERYELVKKNE